MSNKNWYSAIEKMGKGIVADSLPSSRSQILELPSPSLNWALSGGLTFGKIVTVYGPEQSGKSLIAQLAIAQLHKQDPDAWAIWYDAEFSFDKDYAARLGVDTKRLWLIQTNKPTEIFDHFVDTVWPMMQNDGFPLKIFVLDSVKAIRGPREAVADSVEDHVIGDVAGLLQKVFRKIIEPIRKHNILTILVQQVNEEMDPQKVYQGHKWHLPSGMALKHMSDYMILVEKVDVKTQKTFDETHKGISNMPIQLGHRIRCKLNKNRTGVPHLVAEFQLKYGVGVVCQPQEIAELAVNVGVVEHVKGSSSYKVGEQKVIGFANFVKLLEKSPEVQRELMQKLNDFRDKELFSSAVAPAVADDDIATE